MISRTNIRQVRDVSFMLARCVPIEARFGVIAQHPFTSSTMVTRPMMSAYEEPQILNLTKPEDKKLWLEDLNNTIQSSDLNTIFLYLNKPWCLCWFDWIKDFLSVRDFSNMLGQCWTEEENPNMDVNVKLPTVIDWFKAANKSMMMSEEDYAHYRNLPDVLTLYRGVSVGHVDLGLSWTEDKEKAEWFQHRFDDFKKEGNQESHMLTITCPKTHVLAYFNSRNEDEVVLDVMSVKSLIKAV